MKKMIVGLKESHNVTNARAMDIWQETTNYNITKKRQA